MDLELLARLVGIEIEDYLELLTFFYESAIAELSKMEEGCSKGLVDIVVNAAHAIKISASNLGIKRISDLSEEIEMQGRDGELNGLEPLVLTLKEELENLIITMKRTAIGE